MFGGSIERQATIRQVLGEPTMASEQEMQRMNEAAEEARKELVSNLENWAAKDVAVWWKSWYMRAGHKRLGRLLVELAH